MCTMQSRIRRSTGPATSQAIHSGSEVVRKLKFMIVCWNLRASPASAIDFGGPGINHRSRGCCPAPQPLPRQSSPANPPGADRLGLWLQTRAAPCTTAYAFSFALQDRGRSSRAREACAAWKSPVPQENRYRRFPPTPGTAVTCRIHDAIRCSSMSATDPSSTPRVSLPIATGVTGGTGCSATPFTNMSLT